MTATQIKLIATLERMQTRRTGKLFAKISTKRIDRVISKLIAIINNRLALF